MASLKILLIAAVVCVLALGLREASAARRQCQRACPAIYAPVCGRRANGSTKEFSNDCVLGVYQCNNPGEIVSSRGGRCK